jgi:hypothetical protein
MKVGKIDLDRTPSACGEVRARIAMTSSRRASPIGTTLLLYPNLLLFPKKNNATID